MNLDELRAFLAVAELGSMAAAAERLGLSRATLRRRVNALEARAGVDLFERDHQGARLTLAGAVLQRRGAALLDESQALLRSLSGYEPYRRAYDARIEITRPPPYRPLPIRKPKSTPKLEVGLFDDSGLQAASEDQRRQVLELWDERQPGTSVRAPRT